MPRLVATAGLLMCTPVSSSCMPHQPIVARSAANPLPVSRAAVVQKDGISASVPFKVAASMLLFSPSVLRNVLTLPVPRNLAPASLDMMSPPALPMPKLAATIAGKSAARFVDVLFSVWTFSNQSPTLSPNKPRTPFVTWSTMLSVDLGLPVAQAAMLAPASYALAAANDDPTSKPCAVPATPLTILDRTLSPSSLFSSWVTASGISYWPGR